MIKIYSRYSLLKRMVQSKQMLVKIIPFDDDTILPYKETSAGHTTPAQKQTSANINAHDLFNYFTADIIKQETTFVR